MLIQRRQFLLAGAALGGLAFLSPCKSLALTSFCDYRLASLEKDANARIGMILMDKKGRVLQSWRADSRFMLCSTFKLLLVAAVLRRSQDEPGLLNQHLTWTEADHINYMPVTEKHPHGMTVHALCEAVIRYSDNLAANRLLTLIGGPKALTRYLRSLGDTATRLDRIEPDLNTLTSNPMLDSTTPRAMAETVRKLVFGTALFRAQQDLLIGWLQGNTTGDRAIRAVVPGGWLVGDKTGSGEYGTTNDVAVMWPTKNLTPLIMTLYMTSHDRNAESRQEILATAAGYALQGIASLEISKHR